VIGDDPRADGIRAQQLLDDEMLRHLLADIEEDAVQALAILTPAQMTDHALLIQRIATLQAAQALPARLESLVTTSRSVDRKPPAVA
jgi:hypothetical protein